MLPILAVMLTLAAPQGQGISPDTLVTPTLWGPTQESAALVARSIQIPVQDPHLAPSSAGTSFMGGPLADTGSAPEMVEYSDAYFTRLTIHRWASYLTLPLFAGQFVVGQKLMNGEGTDQLRGIHGVLAGSLAGLFVVNTITGGLNLYEGRKDPEGRTRRTIHSVLMLLADAGFAATGALAKENENEGGFSSGRSNNNAHRNMAIASMGTALVSYAIMLPIFGRN